MDLNSPLFDRIRAQRGPREEPRATRLRCDSPGCDDEGAFRAPMGRLREGQYFCFCLNHVREYNASYNYFNGMSDEAVARYLKDATVGHRPTWAMGAKREAPRRSEPFAHASRAHSANAPRSAPYLSPVSMRALEVLGLDETASAGMITARYKELVKRHHPDANGGDRSTEDRLIEIIKAYNYLKTVVRA